MQLPGKLAIIAGCLLGLDACYLTLLKSHFMEMVRKVQGSELTVRYTSAIACYVFLVGGLYYFILKDRRSPVDAFLFGLVVYGVYDTTTYALLKNWRLELAVIDTLWGGVLFYLTSKIYYWLVAKNLP